MRAELNWRSILNSQQLRSHPAGQKTWVAALVVVHQAPPTAKGHRFINVIVYPADGETISERLKSTISVIDFVSRYVVLDEHSKESVPFQ